MSNVSITSIKIKKRKSSIAKMGIQSKIIIGIFITIVILFYVYPILNLVNVSFKTSMQFMIDPIGLSKQFNFSNYAKVFVQGHFLRNFYNSISYLFFSNILVLSITSLAAFVISRKYIRFAGFFYVLFLAGMFLPDPLIPQFILMRKLNLYNTPIGYIFTRTNPGVIMLLMTGYYRTLPKSLDEAAVLDGCGMLRYITFFIVPMSKPVFASAFILFSVGVWNDIVGTTVFLTSPQYFPVIRALFAFRGVYGNDWPPLAAAVFIVASPLIIIFLIFQKYIVGGMVAGGVKG